MTKRFMTVIAALAIATLTAGGGVALANHGHARHVHAVHHKAHHHAARGAAIEGAGASQESAADPQESATEAAGNDGPGGHEDPAGTEADHQFEGQE
jgi:hypothetical protein